MEKPWRDLAREQHGVISRAQLRLKELTTRQIDRLVLAGALTVAHRGVYRLPDAPPTFDQRVMAACLVSRGVASHRSAAALWELRGCAPGTVEITVTNGRHPERAAVVTHTTTRLAKVDVGEVRAIPVTTPGRTLLDLGMVASRDTVESALEDALHRGLVSVRWLERVIDRGGGQGRHGTATLRSLLDERQPGQRATESVLEDELVRLLRRAGLPPAVRQYEIGSVRVDVCYPAARLVIEAQSMLWHAGRAELQRDCDRLNALVQHGWRVLAFTWHDVRQRPGWVVATVRAALGSAQAQSLSLPA